MGCLGSGCQVPFWRWCSLGQGFCRKESEAQCFFGNALPRLESANSGVWLPRFGRATHTAAGKQLSERKLRKQRFRNFAPGFRADNEARSTGREAPAAPVSLPGSDTGSGCGRRVFAQTPSPERSWSRGLPTGCRGGRACGPRVFPPERGHKTGGQMLAENPAEAA